MPQVSHKMEKIDAELEHALNRILREEVNMEQFGIITVTLVEAAKDLYSARVWISVLGADAEGALEYINRHIHKIQQALNKSVRMRHVPKISFKIDKAISSAQNVEKLFREL